MADVPMAPAVARPRSIGGRLNSVLSQARVRRLRRARSFLQVIILRASGRTKLNPCNAESPFQILVFPELGTTFSSVAPRAHSILGLGLDQRSRSGCLLKI